MKLFLKILAGFLILFILLVVGLNLYFTDDRLKSMIMPNIKDTIGTDVQVDQMSLTFFRTFPQFGVKLNRFVLPDPDGKVVASLDELLVGVELFPLLSNEISISELRMNSPKLTYKVFQDSTSNIDFLMELAGEEEDPATAEEGYAIAIPYFTIQDGSVSYLDEPGNTEVMLNGLNATISLRFSDLIESDVEADLGSLSAVVGGSQYVDNLALSLNQTSSIDLENELLTLTESTLSIRGLGLNLSGSVSDWSADSPSLDIQFRSSSENFGELLRLAPPEYEDQLAGLQTRGALQLEGYVTGSFTEEELPAFDLLMSVSDGFVQNPELPDAIEDINFSLSADNELATLSEFSARAAQNSISGSGTIERPLDEDAVFSVSFDGDVDLATVSQFYPIEELGIQDLRGLLAADLTADGRIDLPEDASFDGNFVLTDGSLQYVDVPKPIEQINAKVQASQDRVVIEESGFRAASNRFSMNGSVSNPLDEENRSIDLSAVLNFDLATIKDFYPIDEDTLQIRGQFDANVTLRGAADPDQMEQLLQRSTFQLQDGYIAHRDLGRPLEDIVLEAEASGASLSISTARFTSGQNSLAMNGSVTNYLDDEPLIDLTFDGNALFSDISTYYSLEPWISELTGDATMNVNVRGQAGDPRNLALNGSLQVQNVSAIGDSIPLPVTGLNGNLTITPDKMTLENFQMNYGSSDIGLEGEITNYMGFLEETHEGTSTMPAISGSYNSRLLNMDELIDWEEETDPNEPVPIDLPPMTSTVSAEIDTLIFFGISITNISGNGRTTPEAIILEDLFASLFEGTANGSLKWSVPSPDRTNLSFEGSLDTLAAGMFFRDTGFLGEDSQFHEYITGQFSTDISYFTELDETVTPDMGTSEADGTFGMTKARMQGHPIQERLAVFLNDDNFRNLALDEWTATYTLQDTVLSFEDFRLTSENRGVELEGTQHMITDRINYKATLLLPPRFKNTIAGIISERGANAMQREDGTMAVPIKITGTSENPRVGPDSDLIQEIIRDALREGAGNALKKLFDG